MRFPVVIKFKRALKLPVGQDRQPAVIDFIEEAIRKKKADNILVSSDSVSYKGSTSFSRTAFFGGLRGSFYVLRDGKNTFLIYEMKMYKLFIASSIMSVAAAIVSKEIWFGVFAFCWLCGANWVISILRHSSFATELAADIDTKCGYIPSADTDDSKMTGELKSWM